MTEKELLKKYSQEIEQNCEIQKKMTRMNKLFLYTPTCFVPWTFLIGSVAGLAISNQFSSFSAKALSIFSFVPISACLMITAKYSLDKSDQYISVLKEREEKQTQKENLTKSSLISHLIKSEKMHTR